ncbi:MAG: SH3 domain-containing protein [Rhizobiaceae bacterium]|nr:SH3 domain-containing protein [Rhizobiaceae bacterium]
MTPMMVRLIGLVMGALMALAIPVGSAGAQDGMETLRFRPGATNTVVRGLVVGRGDVNYRLEGRAGQRMSLDLRSRNNFLYFNVFDPRGRVIAREETNWSDRLRTSGFYRVQVFLMRSEARRDKVVPFTLEARISGRGDDGQRPQPLPDPGAGTYRVVGVAVDDRLNMRDRPGSRSPIIGEIPFDGTGIRRLGCTPDERWCEVRYRSQQGWVDARFLRRER